MAVVRLNVLLLLMWVAIPGLSCQERGPFQQDSTPIPDTYLNVEGGGCLQQSQTPANLETACQFCEDNGGRLVDLDIFADRNLGPVLNHKNITMWIQFDCMDRKRCKTLYPYRNVSCSEEYFYFCFHNKTDDEKCRDVLDTTPTETPTTDEKCRDVQDTTPTETPTTDTLTRVEEIPPGAYQRPGVYWRPGAYFLNYQ